MWCVFGLFAIHFIFPFFAISLQFAVKIVVVEEAEEAVKQKAASRKCKTDQRSEISEPQNKCTALK